MQAICKFNLLKRVLLSDCKKMSSFLSQKDAIALDVDLLNECGYSIDQLMELAGFSVASVIYRTYPPDTLNNKRVLICCGPGNNGGDGLVASRHLKLFGYEPEIYYPKAGKTELFSKLVRQCETFEIKFIKSLEDSSYSLLVDSLFGFSFKPPVREDFVEVLRKLQNWSKANAKLISVDIPSGWHVEDGPSLFGSGLNIIPHVLVSLSAPKLCANKLPQGVEHWLGGRFLPPQILSKYHLDLPPFPSTDQCVKLN